MRFVFYPYSVRFAPHFHESPLCSGSFDFVHLIYLMTDAHHFSTFFNSSGNNNNKKSLAYFRYAIDTQINILRDDICARLNTHFHARIHTQTHTHTLTHEQLFLSAFLFLFHSFDLFERNIPIMGHIIRQHFQYTRI